METRGSEGLEKTWKELVSGSQETDDGWDKGRPELLSEDEKTWHANQGTRDREPGHYLPIQRNSVFNPTVKHKSKGQARDAPEQNTPHQAGEYQGQLALLSPASQVESSGLKGPN